MTPWSVLAKYELVQGVILLLVICPHPITKAMNQNKVYPHEQKPAKFAFLMVYGFGNSTP
jgi:hypothetical protein